MTISQERFDRVTDGLLEFIVQRHLQLQQAEICLKERDERLATQSNELKSLSYNLVQANSKVEIEKERRLAAEVLTDEATKNIEAWDKKFEELEQTKEYNIETAQRIITSKDLQIAALQATISKQRKVISKFRKQKAYETKITFK